MSAWQRKISADLAAQLHYEAPLDGKPFEIAFYGIGPVAEEAIKAIRYEKDVFPSTIHLFGSDTQKASSNRNRLARELRLSDDSTIVAHDRPQELSDVVANLDLVFFTANNNALKEVNRNDPARINNNLPLLRDFASYFSSDFKGTIDVVTNLPEALAHYVSDLLADRLDPRQITAHIPLDSLRFEFIAKRLLEIDSAAGVDALVGGYHEFPWPILNDVRTWQTVEKQQRWVPVWNKHDLGVYTNGSEVIKALRDFPRQQLALSKKATDVADGSVRGPTKESTGYAIMELAKAVAHGGSTICSIPQEFDGEWFYAMRPVTFRSGWAELDTQRFDRFSAYDRAQDKDRIVGPGESLKNVIKTSQIGDSKISGKPTKNLESRVYVAPEQVVVDAPVRLNFTTYSVSPLENHVITQVRGNEQSRGYPVRIDDVKYRERSRIRKLVVGDKLLFAELYFSHNFVERSSWISFRRNASGLEEVDRIQMDTSVLHLEGILEDTAVWFDGSLYFVAQGDAPSSIMRYTPSIAEIKEIAKGPLTDPINGMAALSSGLVFAGSNHFYQMHHGSLRCVGDAVVPPMFLKSLPSSNIIFYSDRESENCYVFKVGSSALRSPLMVGSAMDVKEDGYVVLACMPNGFLMRSEYVNADQLLQRRALHSVVSNDPIPNIKRICAVNTALTLAVSSADDTLVSVLDRQLRVQAQYTLPQNSYYTFAVMPHD